MSRKDALIFTLLMILAPALPRERASSSDAAQDAPNTTGATTAPPMDSWLTDTIFQRVSDVYSDEFQVVTRKDAVTSTNPGGFYYNVLVTTSSDMSDFTLSVSLPQDFGTWGANCTHVWMNSFDVTSPDDETAVYAGGSLVFGPTFVPANTVVFMTVHVRYTLASLPSADYLPRVYTFSSSAGGGGFSATHFASMTGVLKK